MIFIKQNKTSSHSVGGYTIIELVVGISLFVVVALIGSTAFLGVMSSNRKTLAIRTAVDNLGSAVESMSRDMKTGSSYHCETSWPPSGTITLPSDCSVGGGGYLALEGQKGDPTVSTDQIVYQLGSTDPNCPVANNQICKSIDGGSSFFAVTAPSPELNITGLAFRVFGSDPLDFPRKQPRIVIVILGEAGVGNAKSTFDIETSVSQRVPDQT